MKFKCNITTALKFTALQAFWSLYCFTFTYKGKQFLLLQRFSAELFLTKPAIANLERNPPIVRKSVKTELISHGVHCR